MLELDTKPWDHGCGTLGYGGTSCSNDGVVEGSRVNVELVRDVEHADLSELCPSGDEVMSADSRGHSSVASTIQFPLSPASQQQIVPVGTLCHWIRPKSQMP